MIRLLQYNNDGEFSLTTFFADEIPEKYAILSHTWEAEEVTFEDLQGGTGTRKAGYNKIRFCGEQARRDGLQYFWVDTCCIDKSSSAELSEAINSMFRWYRQSTKCYAYLSDVLRSAINTDDLPWESAFRNSKWFTRGWTLQELIAPESVEFFSAEGILLGDKTSMEQQIHEITNIPVQALRGYPLSEFTVAERLSWAANRKTTRKEDQAYCLLGIFDISMPSIYGEEKNAFARLEDEIERRSKRMMKAKHLSGTSILRSDSIFSQQRLIPRDDVKEFLADAFRGAGTVRAVIHGLPGIGKSTMARHFAQQHQEDMAVLWIPAATEADMTIAFKQYAQQISEEEADYPEPVSLVGRLLSERFPGNWVVILDGLDDASINVQRYNFADLPASKILVTTRNKGLASHIGATHILPINPLDETTALSLLSTYMFTGPMPSSQNGLRENEISQGEKEARRRLVKELGGPPLAISIIGSSMREDGRASDIKCHTYLTWSDLVKDILLEQDPEFPDYSSSVWKTFTFAFQKLLLDTAGNQHTKSMACFAASCENGSNFAGYLRLYRQIRSGNGNNVSGCAAMDQMKFLDNGFFEVTIAKLAASNLITLNWIEDGPINSPYIEIHSLVRRWLERQNRNQILAYTSPKLWLLGFGMYDQILRDQVGLKDFAPLINEMKAHLSKVPCVAQNSCVPTTQIIFPFLIEAHRGLAKSIAHLPPSSAPRSRLHEFSKHLESEIAESYTNNLEDLDWGIVFRDFMEEFKEQVDYAAKSDANRQEYTLKDFFLKTLDYHGCIPIAFRLATPSDFSCVGQSSFIEAFAAEIIDAVECLLDKHLSKEAIRQLGNLPREEFGEPISQWCRRWNDDIEEIISRSLDRVVAKCITGDDIETHPTERPTPMTSVSGAEGLLGFLTTMTSSDKPRNAFFAVLRRATIAATGQFLSTSPVVDILNGLRDEFGDACAAPLQKHLGERALSMQHGSIAQFPTSEAREDLFSVLWQLAWPMRFPCALESLIAQQVVDSISKDLKNSAREGFLAAIKGYCLSAVSDGSSEVAEYLTEEVFQESGISNLFPNWIASGWIDLPSDNDDSDDEEEPSYIRLLDEARSLLLEAMQLIYQNHDDVLGRDTALYAVKRTLEFRKELHNTVMGRLNQPDLTDKTGVGAFFAKIYFADCDLGLRQVYSLLHDSNLKNDVDLLEALVSVEDQWSRHKEHPSSTEE